VRFYQNVEYQRPAGHTLRRIYIPFQDALAVKISLNLLKELRCYLFIYLFINKNELHYT